MARFKWNGTPLSTEDLDAIAGKLSTQEQPGTARFNFMIHAVIIRYFLGDDWFREHFLPDSRLESFFRPDFSDQEVDPRYSALTLELAENLLNLQGVLGFSQCLEHFALRQMESGLAELQIGQLLTLCGVPFRYVEDGEPTTVDLVFKTPSGLDGLGEIKCKYEKADYSDSTLRDALATARKQIGKGNAGVVFVKIPTAWVDVSRPIAEDAPKISLPPRIVAAAKGAMMKSSRIKKVIFYVFHHDCDLTRGVRVTHAAMEMTSPKLDVSSPWRTDLLVGQGSWDRMDDLAKRWN